MVGPFVSPATGIHPLRKTVHYLPIDARAGRKRLSFIIGGCKEAKVPINVFALTTRRGNCNACLICHWEVDFCDPHINLDDADETLVIVPVGDRLAASQILVLECQCKLLDARDNK
jgi:predicted metal-binding protein